MPAFEILIEGYARREKGRLIASPTTVLLRDQGRTILVDPGANAIRLRRAFEQRRLRFEQVDLIFLTHCHLDHLLNIRLFPQIDVADGSVISRGEALTEYETCLPGTSIRVIPTPGHTPEHWALGLETSTGRVAIAGDVFWWFDDQEPPIERETLLNHEDPYAHDRKALRQSRQMLLDAFDQILPGHGRRFEVPR